MAYSTFATFQNGDAELPDIASQLTALAKNVNVINRYHNVTS